METLSGGQKLIGIMLVLILSIALVSAGNGHAPRIHIKNGISPNWAGYAVATNLSNPRTGSVTDVKSSWVVPSVNCSASELSYSSVWVGIDGYTSSTVEQIGTDSDCTTGSPKYLTGVPTYYAWYELYPKALVKINMNVSPGDMINAEVKYAGGDTFVLTINDTTKKTSYSVAKKVSGAQRSSAEWIVESPTLGGLANFQLSNFGVVKFTHVQATINGVTGGIKNSAWQYDLITMTAGDTIRAKTSSTRTVDNSSLFMVKWMHF